MFQNKSAFLILATIFFTGLTSTSFSQDNTGARKYLVRIAGSDSVKIPHLEIVANPVLTAKDQGCEVTGFTLTFIPKGGYLSGPYKTKGNRMQENHVNYLKEFTNRKISIVFEDVQLKCQGKDVPGATLFIKSIPAQPEQVN